jgi:hypothetical protein
MTSPAHSATTKPTETRLPVPELFSATVAILRHGGFHRLVTVRAVALGERLFHIEGRPSRQPNRYSVQVDEDVHLNPFDAPNADDLTRRAPWQFMNHACEPTTRLQGTDVFAVRDLHAGEEVTFNYLTTEFHMAEPFACHCGSPRCLGRIGGFKLLPPAERERLRPWLAPHLARRLSPEAVQPPA